MTQYVLVATLALFMGNTAESQRSMLVQEMKDALASFEENDPQATESLRSVAARASQSLGEWSEAGSLLATALRWSEAGYAGVLENALTEAVGLLSFEPLVESPMPDGFPATTAVGEIELKDYPRYRMARTTMSNGNSAFFTLFRHIQRNEISMTAPVEMTYPREANGDATMAFLYGPGVQENPEAGRRVEIVEVEPLTVVSIGNRGRRTNARVEWAKQRLEAWLEANRPDLRVHGPLRVLGYNSPMVPTEKRYFEVQLEVRPATQTEVF